MEQPKKKTVQFAKGVQIVQDVKEAKAEQSVILQHPEMAPWYVRKPPTSPMVDAIRVFMKNQGCPDDTDFFTTLSGGALYDEGATIAELGLTPKDVVKVNWDVAEAAKVAADFKQKKKATAARASSAKGKPHMLD